MNRPRRQSTSPEQPPSASPPARPRVLVVGPRPGPNQTGGIEMFNAILLESDLGEHFELIHLDTSRTRAGKGKAATLALINFVYFFAQAAKLTYLLIVRRPQIMHQPITDRISFWKEGAFMLLARLCGVRVVGHLHGGLFKDLHGRSKGWVRRLIRRILRLPAVIITLSEGWRAYLLEEVASDLTVVVVPNTVDPAIAALAFPPKPSPASADCTVLYMGNLSTYKGVLDALQAIPAVHSRFPGTRFVFAGAVKRESEKGLMDQACRAALEHGGVSFPGVVSGADKLALFQEASIFWLPSYFENLPIVVLEALAAGLPLVVTPVGALPEMLEDGRHALFVTPGDVPGLAASLTRLIASPDLRERMGAANRAAFLCQYEPHVVLGKIEEVYWSLLDAPSGGRAGARVTPPPNAGGSRAL